MTPAGSAHQIDGRVARLLSALPAYHDWRNRPLDRALRKQLAQMDDEALMSLAAEVLVMLEQRRSR